MLIKKIRLKNIRSYLDQEIVFPDGNILLSGDIGSGKSTVLLAIDFALFGIRRGELSGSALLRNGADEGFVNLNLLVNSKEVIIKRILKKTSNGIVQDAGYLSVNDVTKELTPVELKSKILELLNYPGEISNKKSLVYRYTVYTPQEEMKLILLGEKEHRIETLRKVFNIDKYSRIRDNSKIVLSEVKQRKKENSLFIQDLDIKKLKLQELNLQIVKANEGIELNKKRIETVNSLLESKKIVLNDFEDKIKKCSELKKDFEVLISGIKSKEELKLRGFNQILNLEKQIVDVKNLNLVNEDFKSKIIENEKLIENLEKELKEVFSKKIEFSSKKKNSEEIKNKVLSLDYCPLCKQNVSSEHKHQVTKNEDEIILNLDNEIKSFISKELELVSKINIIKDTIKTFRDKDREFEVLKVRLVESDKKKELISNLKKEQEELDKIIDELKNKNTLIENELNLLKDLDDSYNIIKKEYDVFLEEKRKLEMNIALLNKDLELVNKQILEIKLDIDIKEKKKEKHDYYVRLQDWLEKLFIPIIETIEKKVMLKLNVDFNLLFQKWFSMLIDTDIIRVRLDEEFTPLIEQNGHDIEYENLSGGEKTACALAYRLSLNQVINGIISGVNTKDIIILDEPTDGFSSEQLDKMREVLRELNMKQIIIVSHETKIESFVDNIIRVSKEGHVSNVYKF